MASATSTNEGQKEPRRSMTCSICLAISGNYNLNYGAPSCFGCRAFFRRVVQGNSINNLFCVNKRSVGIPCDVTGTGKKCRKCRWDKCIRFGMSVEKVMIKKDIDHRFRKSLKKKRREQRLKAKQEATERRKMNKLAKELNIKESEKKLKNLAREDLQEILASKPQQSDLEQVLLSSKSSRKRKSDMPLDLLFVDDELQQQQQPIVKCGSDKEEDEEYTISAGGKFKIFFTSKDKLFVNAIPLKKCKISKCKKYKKCVVKEKFRKLMKSYSLQLTNNWNKVLAKIDFNPLLLIGLVGFFHGDPNMSESISKSHFLMVVKLFTDFALSQEFFRQLETSVQRKLFVENSLLFIQFFIAKGIQVDSGNEQISCWFCDQMPSHLKNEYEDMNLEKKSLWQWDEFTQLFAKNRDLLQQYYSLIQKVQTRRFPSEMIPFLAKACLLDAVHPLLETNKVLVGEREEFYNFIEWTHETLGKPSTKDIKLLLKSLSYMKLFFLENARWRNTRSSIQLLTDYLPLPMTFEEELYFSNCITLFHDVLSSIPVTEDYTKPIVEKDAAVPRNFSRLNYLLWTERIRSAMKTILRNETDISTKMWRQILANSNNCAIFLLCMARLECFDSRLDQARFYHGRKDNIPAVRNDELVFSFNDLVPLISKKCVTSDDTSLSSLGSKLKSVLDEKDLFYLMFFFMLFNVDDVNLKTFIVFAGRRFANTQMYSISFDAFLNNVSLVIRTSKSIDFNDILSNKEDHEDFQEFRTDFYIQNVSKPRCKESEGEIW